MNSGNNMLTKANFLIILLLAWSTSAWCDSLSGLWQEFDDDTKQPAALIKMEMQPDGTYQGVIEKIFPTGGSDAELRCTHCRGNLLNQPLVGLRIVSGMRRKDGSSFEGGSILDPDDGKTYHCRMQLSEDGNALKVTGYPNVAWIGQSETWRRIQ
jgi:uncharacterized protein (DUF2147 family)